MALLFNTNFTYSKEQSKSRIQLLTPKYLHKCDWFFGQTNLGFQFTFKVTFFKWGGGGGKPHPQDRADLVSKAPPIENDDISETLKRWYWENTTTKPTLESALAALLSSPALILSTFNLSLYETASSVSRKQIQEFQEECANPSKTNCVALVRVFQSLIGACHVTMTT